MFPIRLCLSFVLLVIPALPVAAQTLEYSGLDRTVIRFSVDEFLCEDVSIGGREFETVHLANSGSMLRESGCPGLPYMTESIMVPDAALMKARVLSSEFHEIDDFEAAPSKGVISRSVDPATVPYTFADVYKEDAFYPGDVMSMTEPFILHDVRGVTVQVYPFQYNPVRKVLRVYTEVFVEVSAQGADTYNVIDRSVVSQRPDRTFEAVYRSFFANYAGIRIDPPAEDGDLLIISTEELISAVQPLVDWKNSIGVNTTLVDLATIGSTAQDVKDYITGAYYTSNLSFVLLVGDGGQMPTLLYGYAESDPSYSLVTADLFPDLFVGRFSAETPAQAWTQCERTIQYEQMEHDVSLGGWNAHGMGIASAEGAGIGHYGESDIEHEDIIRSNLLNYGFTKVDQVYDPGATKTQVIDGLNEGRRIVNYTGHGSSTYWNTTGFSNSNIDRLKNANRLPFVCSAACWGGNFNLGTCFGEAWLRATDNGAPAGAIAAYCSSGSQPWATPMTGQANHAINGKYGGADRFWTEMNWSIAGCWYGGGCAMMELEGTAGRDVFMRWNLFGDPSVRITGAAVNQTLSADAWSLPVNQPVNVNFTVCPGPDYAGYKYCLLSAVTGTMPGTSLPNGLEIPLNFDAWTYFVLMYLNTPTFKDFYGTLDANGEAVAAFDTTALIPIAPQLAGCHLHFCAVMWNNAGYEICTNPRMLVIVE